MVDQNGLLLSVGNPNDWCVFTFRVPNRRLEGTVNKKGVYLTPSM